MSVVIVLAIVICIAWFVSGSAHAWKIGRVAAAFLLGVVATYVAMHVYKHK